MNESKVDAGILYVKYARFNLIVLQDDSEALRIYREAVEECKENKYVISNYLLHLSMIKGSIDNLLSDLFELLKNMESDTLDSEYKKEIYNRIKNIYLERGFSIEKVQPIEDCISQLSVSTTKHPLPNDPT